MRSAVKPNRFGNATWILTCLLLIAAGMSLTEPSLTGSEARPPAAKSAVTARAKNVLVLTPIPKVQDDRSLGRSTRRFEDNQEHQILLLTEGDMRSSVSLFRRGQLLAKAEPTWQVFWNDGVFEADFNQDGNLDFLVEFGSPANGLPRDARQLVFFLSDRSGKEYRPRIVHSSAWSTNDFLIKDQNGPCQYRHTGLLDLMEAGFKPRSGLNRELETYFWVYQILEFRDTRLVAIPGKGYPKFVEFNKFGESSGLPHHLSAHRKEMLAQDLLRQMIPE